MTLDDDLKKMVRTLTTYVDKGRAVGTLTVEEEPISTVNVEVANYIPLIQMSYNIVRKRFLAVDCSTVPLMRANNWGVYLLRVAYALIEPPEREDVDWDFSNNIVTIIGDKHQRMSSLQNERAELESKMALDIVRKLDAEDYLLLDGAGYFGGYRMLQVSLYNECEQKEVRLLAISKNAPSILDNKGRDLIASLLRTISYPFWAVLIPTMTANIHEHRYGDTHIIKLSPEVPVALRCDVMEYLGRRNMTDIFSALTCLAQDSKCEGYPVALYLAHDFTLLKSSAKLLEHRDRVEDTLRQAGILDILGIEESVASLRDRLHGLKHPSEWEGSDLV